MDESIISDESKEEAKNLWEFLIKNKDKINKANDLIHSKPPKDQAQNNPQKENHSNKSLPQNSLKNENEPTSNMDQILQGIAENKETNKEFNGRLGQIEKNQDVIFFI